MSTKWLDPNKGMDAENKSYISLSQDAGANWKRTAQLTAQVPAASSIRTKSVNVSTSEEKIDYDFLPAGTLITEIYIAKLSGSGNILFRVNSNDDFVSIGSGVALKMIVDPINDTNNIPELKTDSSTAVATVITSVIG